MSTGSQSGTFEVGTYGYPITITLSSPPDAPVNLANVTGIKLSLTAPNSAEPEVDQRAVDPTDGWIHPGGGVSDSIQWMVENGDHDVVGKYLFKLEIDSDGGTKHLVTTGSYLVQ